MHACMYVNVRNLTCILYVGMCVYVNVCMCIDVCIMCIRKYVYTYIHTYVY
jgi:hypothetical protein